MMPKRVIYGLRLKHGRPAETGRGIPDMMRDAVAAGAEEIALLDQGHGLGDVDDLARATTQARRALGSMPLLVGGGVASIEDVSRLMRAGASRVLLGTAAVANPELVRQVADRFGSQCVSVLIEVRLERRRGEATVDLGSDGTLLVETDTTGGWYRVYVRGGNTATSRDAIAWAHEVVELGAGELVVAAIEPTGEALEYDLELIGRITESVQAAVVAAGPAEPIELIRKALTLSGASGVLLLDGTDADPGQLRRLHDELERTGITLAAPM